jgi:hypothetical protein
MKFGEPQDPQKLVLLNLLMAIISRNLEAASVPTHNDFTERSQIVDQEILK